MRKITAFFIALLLSAMAFSQNKLDNLTDSPVKENEHFVGKTGGVVSSDPYMTSYAIAFDFWTLFGEPVYMFRFRWDMKTGAESNTIKVNNMNKRFADYPEVWGKMKSRLTPLTSMDDSELLTIPLYIQLRQGSKVLAHITHLARIDLPDSAGKWNILALAGSDDWIKAFRPTQGGTSYIPFKTAGHEPFDYKLHDLYKSGNKEEYANLIKDIWKEADNIKVASGTISNIRWNVSDYEYAIKEKMAEQKAAVTATKTTEVSELDELLGSTGYSKEDQAKRKANEAKGDINRANAAYNKVMDYRDKTALNEAKRLYQQAASDPESAAYAENQIAMIDRVLNYREPNISRNLDGVWIRSKSDRLKIEVQGNNAVLIESGTNSIWIEAANEGKVMLNSTLKYKDIKNTGDLTWSCLDAWLSERNGNLYIYYEACSINMSADGNSFTTRSTFEGNISTHFYERVIINK